MAGFRIQATAISKAPRADGRRRHRRVKCGRGGEGRSQLIPPSWCARPSARRPDRLEPRCGRSPCRWRGVSAAGRSAEPRHVVPQAGLNLRRLPTFYQDPRRRAGVPQTSADGRCRTSRRSAGIPGGRSSSSQAGDHNLAVMWVEAGEERSVSGRWRTGQRSSSGVKIPVRSIAASRPPDISDTWSVPACGQGFQGVSGIRVNARSSSEA